MVKFHAHYVTDGVTRARVSYCDSSIFVGQQLRECITLYAKDYSDALGKVFPGRYENDTEIQTDYLDEGRVRIFPGDALYSAAKQRCDEQAARWAAKHAKRAA